MKKKPNIEKVESCGTENGSKKNKEQINIVEECMLLSREVLEESSNERIKVRSSWTVKLKSRTNSESQDKK